jgi:hypothetical protein
MGDASDSPVDPELAAKLQAGERVWLKREGLKIAAASVLTFFTVLMIAMLHQDPVGLWIVAFLGLYVSWGWVRILAIRVGFTETTVEASEQVLGLSLNRIRLKDIVAAQVARSGYDNVCICVCQLSPGQQKGARWVALWVGPSKITANTLLAEVSRRCGLTEISPASQGYRTTVWQRPGIGSDVLPMSR